MRTDKLLALKTESITRVWNLPRTTFLLSTFLGLALLTTCFSSCAPSSPQNDSKPNSPSSASSETPELTENIIRDRINQTRIRQIPEENGAGEPISWSFYQDEPKEITVVEKRIEGDRATIVLDIKTQSAPKAREPRYLAGQIRTEWELKTGWVLRQWEIVKTENVSMKYRNLPKPSPPAAQNSNR